ncbi:hypothetical protein AYI70_g11037 [Smittium culicis]|uniref:Uncharacterized protein n=1 Tax=Smittium culicis TaxID=133412 RepID=A0A1R1X3P7_9FUNG|nr:hypothetical protein AYI70_g11037 [Smittium culicis]
MNDDTAGTSIDTIICSTPTEGSRVLFADNPTEIITTKLAAKLHVSPASITQYPAPRTIAVLSKTSEIPILESIVHEARLKIAT